MKNYWVIQYVANAAAMSKATLANAGVDPFDDTPQGPGPALFANEFDAQDAAAEYEYYVLSLGGNPADIVIAEYDGPVCVRTMEVI